MCGLMLELGPRKLVEDISTALLRPGTQLCELHDCGSQLSCICRVHLILLSHFVNLFLGRGIPYSYQQVSEDMPSICKGNLNVIDSCRRGEHSFPLVANSQFHHRLAFIHANFTQPLNLPQIASLVKGGIKRICKLYHRCSQKQSDVIYSHRGTKCGYLLFRTRLDKPCRCIGIYVAIFHFQASAQLDSCLSRDDLHYGIETNGHDFHGARWPIRIWMQGECPVSLVHRERAAGEAPLIREVAQDVHPSPYHGLWVSAGLRSIEVA
mmetsp:Transcript_62496/g.116162  ORF Transcript_62496/g.116162 Transcript_62496/m.116162 type:complete len:266 (-) Transcript_62496:341-1138(-)